MRYRYRTRSDIVIAMHLLSHLPFIHISLILSLILVYRKIPFFVEKPHFTAFLDFSTKSMFLSQIAAYRNITIT